MSKSANRETRRKQKDEPVIEEIIKPVSKPLRFALHASLIALALFVGLFVRFHYLSTFLSQPSNSFNGSPILSTADAYYFTKFARERFMNEYHANQPDQDRDVPDSMFPYPNPIPMISYLTAMIAKITHADIDHVAFYLPPILAVFCVVPIYLVGLELSGAFVGWVGALLSVSYILYLVRSCLGRFDTDCLNLFFLFLIPYFLLKSWQASRRSTAFFFAGGAGISLWLFNWWYDHPGFAIPFLVVFGILLLLPRQKGVKTPHRDKGLVLLIFVLLSNPLQFFHAVSGLTNFFWNHLFPVTDKSGFPNILISVSESTHYTIDKTLGMIQSPEALGITIGTVALIGLAGLLYKSGRRFLPFLPALALGLFAFTSGNRFAMYLAPFLGMGLGFAAEKIQAYLIERKLKPPVLRYASLVVLGAVCVAATVSVGSFYFMPEPRFPATIYRGIDALRKLSPTGNVWTWWDWGYAIEDIGQKATYTDGGSYRKAYFVGRSLSTTQPAECRNTMLGVTNLGFKGLYDKMKEQKIENPEPVLEDISQGKYNFKPDRPLYLMFSLDMTPKYYWIYRFGTWDFTVQNGKEIQNGLLEFVPHRADGSRIVCDRGIIDPEKGQLLVPDSEGQLVPVPLQKFYEATPNQVGTLRKDYHAAQGYILVYVAGPDVSLFYAVRPDIFDTVYVQMYLMRNYDPALFEVAYNDYPHVVIYRVK